MHVSYLGPGKLLAHPIKDKLGREILAVALKYSFRVDPSGRASLDEESPTEPHAVDLYNGADPATSSIRKPSDVYDFKPGTDVLLVGHAHPPLRPSVTHVDVSLKMGPVDKTVRARGLRAWQAGPFGGIAPGPALRITEPIPLLYELAWGGLDLSEPDRPVGEPRNTLGRGVAHKPKRLIGTPAAQLEYPGEPIGHGDNVPASFGALCRHWQPRASFAGTYDDAWMKSKMPLPPDDFDPRFNVTAPPDQWSPTPLRGDEPIEARGATPEGLLRVRLPRMSPGFSSIIEGRRSDHRADLDTVLIDADAYRVELTFHAGIPLPRKYQMLESVMIVEKTVLGRG